MWDMIHQAEGCLALMAMYAVVTFIAIRRTPLVGEWRWLYGLTVGPLFFAFVWASSVIARSIFPDAVSYLEAPTFHISVGHALGSAALAFIMLTPVSLLMSWLWFLMCRQFWLSPVRRRSLAW